MFCETTGENIIKGIIINRYHKKDQSPSRPNCNEPVVGSQKLATRCLIILIHQRRYQLSSRFMDVMPPQLPKKFPPRREVDHNELVSEAKPPAKAPYRMSSPELEELQKQACSKVVSSVGQGFYTLEYRFRQFGKTEVPKASFSSLNRNKKTFILFKWQFRKEAVEQEQARQSKVVGLLFHNLSIQGL